MKNILMLENEEIVLVDSKTGKGVYSIKYVNDELSVKKVNIGVNEYYSINKVSFEMVKALRSITDFENRRFSVLPDEFNESYNKVMDAVYRSIEGDSYNICEDSVIEKYYIFVTKYEK